MLVLTRKRNESIMIGDNIEVFIVDIHGEQVKLGIKAPKAIPVHRKEIYEAIQAENIKAVQKTAAKLTGLGKLLKEEKDKNE